MSWTAGSARPSRPRSSLGLPPAPAARATRIFSSLFWPIPERARNRPSWAAVFSPSSVVMPSSVQIRAAVFGPTPGRRRKSTTPAGTFSRRRVSAYLPVRGDLDDLLLDRLADQEIGCSPREGELRDGPGRLADARRSTAVSDDLERLLGQDLRDVREEVELVGDLGVSGQSLRHAAMIRTCLEPSSACPPTTSARTWRRWCVPR